MGFLEITSAILKEICLCVCFILTVPKTFAVGHCQETEETFVSLQDGVMFSALSAGTSHCRFLQTDHYGGLVKML